LFPFKKRWQHDGHTGNTIQQGNTAIQSGHDVPEKNETVGVASKLTKTVPEKAPFFDLQFFHFRLQ